jgi:hypothetical protein
MPSAATLAIALAALVFPLLFGGRAEASTITTGCADLDHACSLEELFAGGSLEMDGLHFSDFALDTLALWGAVGPDPARIQVLGAESGPGLRFEGRGELALLGAGGLDLWFSYRVTPAPGQALEEAALVLDRWESPGGGLLYLDQLLIGDAGVRVAANAVLADPAWGFVQAADASSFPPQGGLAVSSRLHLSAEMPGDALDLGAFSQLYGPPSPPALPLPEPAAPLLFGLNLLLLRAVRASPTGGARRSPRATPPRPARPARS